MLVGRSLPLAQQPRLLRAARDGRSESELRKHYLVERELAERLRSAPDPVRRRLYQPVYDELFRRLPDHPQLRARFHPDAHARRRRDVHWQFRFLRPALGLHTTFAEIGAGDCALARRVAGYVDRVYAIDVSTQVMHQTHQATNVVPVLSDGVSIPVPAGTVDVAFSNQLMEHLHPRDAAEQLANIYRSLAPGGSYFCVTPNRLYGPQDISAYFDEVATGLHLKEYSARELRSLLREAGFRRVRFYSGARGWLLRMPYFVIRAAEIALGALPYRVRKPLASLAPLRALLGLYARAVK
ncbi:MAG TPA: methyltransferase domain-containing protein [Burkholderiales bacterium]|nr:methyltransferase domain-containing protein [Burkholderiales bacterium]